MEKKNVKQFLQNTEAYSEPWQTPNKQNFSNMINKSN